MNSVAWYNQSTQALPFTTIVLLSLIWLIGTLFNYSIQNYTRENAHVVTNLQQTCNNAVPTTCQQDVFALLVRVLLTSCQRLVH
jgi:hypothetical protein